MLLHHFIDRTIDRLPDKIALVAGDERVTNRELDQRINALAALLQTRGVMRGDRVALFLDNSVDMVAGVFAILRIGAVFMPVNPLTKQEKLAFQIGRASCRERV